MSTIYYHFTGATLRDGKDIPPKGRWLVFDGEPIPCECGLHASPDAFDALQYAPGNNLHRVELAGTMRSHGNPVDKFAAQKRKIVATIDATDIVRLFARRVALDVIHLWDAPPVVIEFLNSGDPSKAANAANAANATNATNAANATYATYAAYAAANAAYAAANATYAATYATYAAYAATYATYAAYAAANAAYAAKTTAYRGWFNEMCDAAFDMQASNKARAK